MFQNAREWCERQWRKANPFLPEVVVVDNPVADSEDNGITATIRKSGHPVAATAHLVLAIAPLLLYIFGGIFLWSSSVYTITFLLLSLQLYFLKNFAGRYLVGLRWWMVVTKDGKDSARFEFSSNPEKYSDASRRLFWYVQYGCFGLWCFICVSALLRLKLLSLVCSSFAVSLLWYNMRLYNQASKAANVGGMSLPREISNRVMSAFSNLVLRRWHVGSTHTHT
ncbi:hypothetical protein BLSTO_05836 [Blastocystis sp. subtype 1]